MSFYKGYHKDSRTARYSHLDTKMINNFRGLALLKRQLESGCSVNKIKIVSLARLALLEEKNCIGLNASISICNVHKTLHCT